MYPVLDASENKKANSGKLPTYLKVSVLIVATSFLTFSIYWTIQNIFWFITLTQSIMPYLFEMQSVGAIGTLKVVLLAVQEFSSAVGGFIGLAAGVFAFSASVLYVKGNIKYLAKLRWALLIEAVFFLLLAPSSIHHLVGTAYSLPGTNFYVGLSYLLQVLLIALPLLFLSQKLKKPQNQPLILKLAIIAAPLIVFGLWFKYMFLWIDTLVPMNNQQATPMSTVGAINSLITLLIAGVVITKGDLTLNKNRVKAKKILAAGVVLSGIFFVIFSAVSFFVPIYSSFWYLTDFWMLTLPILGIAYLLYFRSDERDNQ